MLLTTAVVGSNTGTNNNAHFTFNIPLNDVEFENITFNNATFKNGQNSDTIPANNIINVLNPVRRAYKISNDSDPNHDLDISNPANNDLVALNIIGNLLNPTIKWLKCRKCY